MGAREGRQIVKDRIVIVDYKAGNLTSVKLAFDALGAESVVTCDPEVIRRAERVVFSGRGSRAKRCRSRGRPARRLR